MIGVSILTQTVKTALRKSDTFIFQIEFSKLSRYRQTDHPITTAVRNGRLVSPATTTSTTVADTLFTCISQHPEQFHKQDQIMLNTKYRQSVGQLAVLSFQMRH